MIAWSVLTYIATAFAWAMAVTVLRAGHGRSARRLALLLFVDGTAVISTETGLLQYVGSADVAIWISYVHAAADVLIFALYLPFLALALNTPWLAVFRKPIGRRIMAFLGVLGLAAMFAYPRLFVAEAIPIDPPTYVRWTFTWGRLWFFVAIGIIVVLSAGVAASLDAWRRAESELLRRRAKVFLWAFGTRDVTWAGIYLIALFAVNSLTIRHLAILGQIYAGCVLIYSALVGYGILATQLLDIDLKLRWSIKQGTVAAAFVAVFFLVSEAATTLLSDRLGTALGLIASSFLIFMISPLQRFAERFASNAMPHVNSGPEYSSYRKLQIYAAACEAAYQDGSLSDRERKVLDRLKETLGLHPEDAAQVESDFGRIGVPIIPSGV
jgi:hypothetical protein